MQGRPGRGADACRLVRRGRPAWLPKVLYLTDPRPSPPAQAEILRSVREEPVLTVTDERLGAAGGIVHFVLRDGRVRFSLNPAAAQAAGLTLSSKLLALSVGPGR